MNFGVTALLKIGEVAKCSGLPVKTIRYYEDIGLLSPTVERSHTGYRLFQLSVLERLAFIKRSQTLGLSLNEIKTLLQVHDQGELPCQAAKQQLQEKVSILTEQIAALETLRAQLRELLSNWEEHPAPLRTQHLICPNIQSSDIQALDIQAAKIPPNLVTSQPQFGHA
jgi:DNA-binding transcriptional MerR regulator